MTEPLDLSKPAGEPPDSDLAVPPKARPKRRTKTAPAPVAAERQQPVDDAPAGQASSDRPAKTDGKDFWVAYAIQRGRPSYEAWAMTKPDLIKEYADA